jgi:hypothetical protein
MRFLAVTDFHLSQRAYLGNPTDEAYQKLWGNLLEQVATFVKSRADWYRALAYFKISGANLLSEENRLPKHCTPGCGVCNTEVWARAGYTPRKLYHFYNWQRQRIGELFPGKPMTYQLIQAGFPRVSDAGCWWIGPSDPADPLNDFYYGKLQPRWAKVMADAIKVLEDLGAVDQGVVESDVDHVGAHRDHERRPRVLQPSQQARHCQHARTCEPCDRCGFHGELLGRPKPDYANIIMRPQPLLRGMLGRRRVRG